MTINIKENETEVILKQNHKNLYWLRLINYKQATDKELDILVNKFNKIVKEKNIEILTSDIDSYKDHNSFLEKSDMNIFKRKGFYELDLENYHFESEKLQYKSLSNYSESEILKIYAQVVVGDKEIAENITKDFYDTVEYADDENYIEKWKVVLENDTIVGMVFPQVYQDDTKEGSLFYIGVIPKYRKKGLGKEIHAKGLQFLKEYGATKYVGSTDIENESMIKIFSKNNCTKKYIQLYYK